MSGHGAIATENAALRLPAKTSATGVDFLRSLLLDRAVPDLEPLRAALRYVQPDTVVRWQRPDTSSGRSEAPSPAAAASDSVVIASVIKRHKKAVIGSGVVVAALVAVAWFLLHRAPKPPIELTRKRLTFNSSENPVQSATISPDGKYFAYSDTAGIHVKLLLTSEERLIARPAEIPAGASWSVGSWFPDSD